MYRHILCYDLTMLSCDIHTHTPATKSSNNFRLYHLLYTNVIQTVLGMSMGMNVEAQIHNTIYCRLPCQGQLDEHHRPAGGAHEAAGAGGLISKIWMSDR